MKIEPGFYVVHRENATPAFRRIQRSCRVHIAQLYGLGPVLYDGIRVSGDVERDRAAMRVKQEHMKGRLVIVSTDDSRLVGGLCMLGAKEVSVDTLLREIDRMGVPA